MKPIRTEPYDQGLMTNASPTSSGARRGERNKVFAQAFQQDPEFFSFYRSMQAYTKSMGADGTTMVLNPDSEFFKYFGFKKDSGTAPVAPAQ